MTETSWKAHLGARVPDAIGREIDIFETQIELRKRGKIEEKLFAETRLRRGAYGQRYDNGERHDGVETRLLAYPSGELTKGPVTLWDAPGMQRIKLPYGRITAEQMEAMAECAEEYSDNVLHITTRQDVQLHFVHIDDTPDLMRRLAAVGITTREACGNSVRNVTACEYAGVCTDQAFDVTPYAHAATYFLLGHDDTQDFGRKFKIAFSGCTDHPCGLTNFHDAGLIAKVRPKAGGAEGEVERGFTLVIGGGLGSVPHPAKVFDEFVSEEELLPTLQAISRVFARTGERENRARARFKFVLKKMGIDEVNRMIREEREKLRPDPRWTAYLADVRRSAEGASRPSGALADAPAQSALAKWQRSNLRKQAQDGYFVATVTLPLGDMTSDQARALATIARDLGCGVLQATVEQNVCLRWISGADVPELHRRLAEIGLAEPGAGTITDMVACPGTDTCKLGISSSRGLAGELRRRLTLVDDTMDDATRGLHVKMSGCFNACGQHHVADIGFLGVSRNINGRRVPHFQVVVGGEWTHNAGSFGLAIGAIPSKRVPEMLTNLTARFSKERKDGETFQAFIQRIGKKEVRAMVDAVSPVPAYEADPSFYSDWGDPREYSIGDMGVGECAGEVVPYVQMALASSEREVFEAQLAMDQSDYAQASTRALAAMTNAARALVRETFPNISDDRDEIVREFRARLVEPKIFFDPFAGAKFAQYFFRAAEAEKRAAERSGGGAGGQPAAEAAHQLIEEAQLFVDASHQCWERMVQAAQAAGGAS
ncbi:MAG: nitrite/sulfite reductase [Polyangiaceae bacterium]